MIVSNTTPLSNFLHLDRMDILQQLFGEIHIPQAVRYEIEVFFRSDNRWQTYLEKRLIIVHTVQSRSFLNQPLHILHQGEAEALSLSMEHHAALCLIDDKDARVVAALNKIPVTGTLGILIQAKKRGMIDAVKSLMDTLREQHVFWISETMYSHVLRVTDEG